MGYLYLNGYDVFWSVAVSNLSKNTVAWEEVVFSKQKFTLTLSEELNDYRGKINESVNFLKLINFVYIKKVIAVEVNLVEIHYKKKT